MNKNIKILLAEDDVNLGNLLSDYLKAKGYATDLAINGDEAFTLFAKGSYDLCLFDVMMPVKDGFTLAKEIRKINENIPIVFLTAKSMKEDTLQGFESGADDYISKPFSMEELLARITAVLRRSKPQAKEEEVSIFAIGNYNFDYQKRLLMIGDTTQKLTSKENDLLRLLALNQGKILERTYALKAIWGDDNYFNARSMDVYIAKLRKHLSQDERIEIMNVHGRGFRFFVHE
ncbi:response regulator transcription factor [Vicingus serpentipes]|jgi:two-component system, OmpR family, response regulator|uniref:Response regulator transcription factor n=1 Tax=Vicingus serpentipes TaxID=1926625 RepID=A0A5C6RPU0_9FLAO|nr:response regulator transcription factor [Vicingus serpentipes]TXB64381.1 response regulator transcription factor [Vicingus serpentipes]